MGRDGTVINFLGRNGTGLIFLYFYWHGTGQTFSGRDGTKNDKMDNPAYKLEMRQCGSGALVVNQTVQGVALGVGACSLCHKKSFSFW